MSLLVIDSICKILYAHFPSELLAYGCIGENATRFETASMSRNAPIGIDDNALGGITEITLPLCRYIGCIAFRGCTHLRAVHCPEVLEVASGAFEDCTGLKDVDLPKAVFVDVAAFSSCGMEKVVLPACLEIGTMTFHACLMLQQVDLPVCNIVRDKAFYYCQGLRQVDLPVCTDIASDAFEYAGISDSELIVNAPLCPSYRGT